MPWKDATSYSQNGDRTPTTWEYRAGLFRVFVTKNHIYYRPKWAMGITPLIEAREIDLPEAAPVEAAQQQALDVLREYLEAALTALPHKVSR